MQTIQAKKLTDLGQTIFEGAGASAETAQIVASSLVKSNLLGHDSHGVQLIPGYVARIQKGDLRPTATPAVSRQVGAICQVDGNWGFGQLVARFGTAQAIDLARKHGIGSVTLSHSNHIGRLGEYAQMIADAGLVGMLVTGISGHTGTVAPYGGRERIFGTNPMAWGIPLTSDRAPFVLDFATSTVAYGKIAVAASKGTTIPEDALLDKTGNPTIDPQALFDDGIMLAFGKHKGSGLATLVELLTLGLAGQDDGTPESGQIGNPTLITAWQVEAFVEPAQFQSYAESLLQRIKGSQTAAGFDEVLLPGEPEARTYADRAQNGIPIPDPTWEKLTELANRLGR